MCGICGKLVFRDDAPDPNLIRSMCTTITHRGPDDEGVYTAPHIGLGQRRLSIIDLSPTAAPPLPNEDETVWVVFNGEIYNFQSLREQLQEKGHRFRTNTDTEVVVHLYEEHGLACLDHMRGMFSLAVWDVQKKRLFAARDRLGKKPFCYARHSTGIVFGSEIKAITVDPDISVAPDYRALDLYMNYLAVPSPYTAFDGINRLPAGHFLTCDIEGNLEVKAYWTPPLITEKTDAPEEELQEELLRLLRESVRLRMVSDVPLGAFLSGGIDSTAIVALMAQESPQPIKTFSIGFDEEKYNELPYARLLAERYGTDHHEFIVKPDLAEVLPLLVKHYNEPFGDPSAIPTYYVSKMARQHVTVALSGDGGDESFSGYGRYGWMLKWERLNALPRPLRRAVAEMGGLACRGIPNRNFAARVDRAFSMLGGDLRERYLLQLAHVKPSEKALLYTKQFRSILAEESDRPDPVARCAYVATMDVIDWMAQHDQMHTLPDWLMVKSDIASMANSLELRCPLLDHNIVEFAARIPSRCKRDGSGGKLVLKKTVAHLLPKEILTKHKTGFDMPVGEWFRGELSDLLTDTLLSDRVRQRGLLDIGCLNRMIQEHMDGTRAWTNRLWICMMLELWFREFID